MWALALVVAAKVLVQQPQALQVFEACSAPSFAVLKCGQERFGLRREACLRRMPTIEDIRVVDRKEDIERALARLQAFNLIWRSEAIDYHRRSNCGLRTYAEAAYAQIFKLRVEIVRQRKGENARLVMQAEALGGRVPAIAYLNLYPSNSVVLGELHPRWRHKDVGAQFGLRVVRSQADGATCLPGSPSGSESSQYRSNGLGNIPVELRVAIVAVSSAAFAMRRCSHRSASSRSLG